MQFVNHFSGLLFPDPVSFEFKKTDDGKKIKLTFHPHIKMKDFIQEVINKSHREFNIPETKNIEVVEASKRETGAALDSEDETLLSVKYAYSYKYQAFYIRVN
jgi:hypothetical protein